ncbi:MAG: C-GCAxxG-C-C family (seleno)protein [Terriglobales bacterium]
MRTPFTRRELVMLLGGAAGAAGAGKLLFAQQRAFAPKAGGMRSVPWPYKPLDPDIVGQHGFDGYNVHHCMYGAFEAMVAPVAEQLGPPYSEFPFDMFTYGAGGINGWATICGALNGAAAAFQLLSPKPEPLMDTLFNWYEMAPLPDLQPKGAKFAEVRSVANSPLCHQSIVNWCKVAKKKAYSAERKERCGAITASVARKAVLLLNEQAEGKLVVLKPGQPAQTCMSCHEKGGAVENIRTQMDCRGCHAPIIGKHPGRKA